MRLEGKTVLLTGALGSLGRAQAMRLAGAGARILLLDRPGHERGESFAAEVAKTTGSPASFVGQDLAELEAAKARIEVLAKEHDGIDVLINNAALIVNRPFMEFSLAEYEEQLRVNAAAGFALAQAVAPGMIAKRYGKIVNFCSVTLNGVVEGYVPYVASKGALYGLTKTLARELGRHGIRVNAISPGAVRSEAEDRVFGDRLQQYNDWVLDRQSLKERIFPEHIADLVLYLCARESDMITGQNILIDGGW
ncbi:MAG: SDR family oxidoreductase [Chthoniobacterales bacterium]|jgi:NAD(P)-dependent dehydrogenase (short-subunit alcohol dehydrogenase family)